MRGSKIARTTPSQVNRALKAAGLKVEIVRGNGYYWFDDATSMIKSIYANSLRGCTAAEVVDYVQSELNRINIANLGGAG